MRVCVLYGGFCDHKPLIAAPSSKTTKQNESHLFSVTLISWAIVLCMPMVFFHRHKNLPPIFFFTVRRLATDCVYKASKTFPSTTSSLLSEIYSQCNPNHM